MAIQDFLSIRAVVLSDVRLQEQMRAAPDEAAIFDMALTLGRALGYAVSEEDLRAVVNINRRGWLERWLYQ
jgi:hypothetical protein